MASFQGVRDAVKDTPLQLTNSDAVIVNIQNETSGRLRIRGSSTGTVPTIADFNTFSYSLEPGQSAKVTLAESFSGASPAAVRLHGLADTSGKIVVDHN